MRQGLVAILAVLAGPAVAQVHPNWPLADSAITVEGSAVVVSGHVIASQVGRAILEQGGNAIDAAVATGFALAVVYPEAGNVGGGGFMVIRLANGSSYALDYRETAPAKARWNMYIGPDGNPTDKSWTGHLAPGVPGSVAGLAEAHRRFGTLPWRALLEPAIALARDGFVVDQYRHRSIAGDSARLSRFAASAKQFLPDGRPPAPGSVLVQRDLAATLEAIRDRGAAGFYRGPVARLIVAEMRRGGGIISATDLAGYRPRWREPIRFSYRGYQVISMPPVSSGGVTLALMMNILEGYDSMPPFGSADLLHREAEAMRRAFIERNRSLGDPAFVANPIARMTSKRYAARRRAEIDLARATPTASVSPVLKEGASTTHYSVVDRDGVAVSTTTTLNNSYGSAVTVTGAGFLLNDEMDDFTTAPGKPNNYGLVQGRANGIAPGKRMLSAMTPSIVLDREGQLYLVVGTPGGPTIITQVYHVISNLIDHGMSLPAALAAPRLHHQSLPDRILLEDGGFSPEVVAALEAKGHPVATRSYMGDVEAIIRTPRGWLGASDPRRGGGAQPFRLNRLLSAITILAPTGTITSRSAEFTATAVPAAAPITPPTTAPFFFPLSTRPTTAPAAARHRLWRRRQPGLPVP
ncbi:MAG: gamma-glutamyltransferase [Gemmatimonadetes bacterium]|nr:gamma-glutamyltransferase [Gemmatimonadota bacterium]